MCRIENVAGTVESLANLTMLKPVDRGVAPDFKQRISDLRTKQNAPSQFTCVVTGTPQPTATWFKVCILMLQTVMMFFAKSVLEIDGSKSIELTL